VLVSLKGELLAKPIPLERDIVVLGRALEADIRLNDSKVSRLHARIHAEVDEETGRTSYRIKDLGSTNGTMLNGQVINEGLLTNGDKIVVGDHLFRFDLLDEIDREFQQQIQRLLPRRTHRIVDQQVVLFRAARELLAPKKSRAPSAYHVGYRSLQGCKHTYGHMAGSRR
jgi:pSer/pThr/pTyr-binding forkhead associated (FHA) protein